MSTPTNYMAYRRKSAIFNNSQDHLWGIRAILAVQSFAWLFFKVFNSTLTVPGPNPTLRVDQPTATPSAVPGVFGGPGIVARDFMGQNISDIPYVPARNPEYQVVLRKVLEPLLWDESFIFCFFILLSARTVSISFLQSVDSSNYARSLISRPIRMGIPLGVGLAISCAIFGTINTDYLIQFATLTGNPRLRAPQQPPSGLACFNSIWNLLWVTKDYSLQSGNLAFPSWTLWVPSAIYLQSYTVYMLMIILPFSRPSWHINGLFMFAFGSWWFNSWGWYSATGLFLADVAINPPLRSSLMRGLQSSGGRINLPYWLLSCISILVGLGLKYMWTDALPGLYWQGEAYAHPARWTGGSSFGYYDAHQPFPRMDNWLIIVGWLTLLEFSEMGKKILGSLPLRVVGKRSLSYYITSTLIVYTVGIKVYLYCNAQKGYEDANAKAVAFFVCLPASILGGELFYRAIDAPARWAGHAVFKWTRDA